MSLTIVCLWLGQYVLAVGSSVFHAMFYGELAEDQDEIRIPDVEPPSFLAMLKYVSLCFVHSFAETVGLLIMRLGARNHPVTLLGSNIYPQCLHFYPTVTPNRSLTSFPTCKLVANFRHRLSFQQH